MAGQIKRDPLVFGNVQQSGHEELAGASPHAVNVIIDGAGAVHRRPAIIGRDDRDPATLPDSPNTELVSMEGPIVGLHSTAKGRVFAIDAPNPSSRIYELAGHNVYNLSTRPETRIDGGRRPIIAETEAILAITAGGQPMKVVLGAPAVVSPLTGNPPVGSHVIAHADRLLMNDVVADNPNFVRYSATASGSSYTGHQSWGVDTDDLSAGGGFTASARPDPVVAVYENTNEVFVFGTTNLQIFVANPNPVDPAKDRIFEPSNAREFGCSAPYSVVRYDQSFGFVDQYRRIMLTDGRDFRCISQDIQQTLDDIVSWSDVFGYRVTLGPVDALCWCSPTDGRTFAYQVPTKSWSIWQAWNDTTDNFSCWHVRCATRVPETGEMLVGCAVPDSAGVLGNVYALSNRAFVDTAGLESKVVARVDTGFIDRGTSGRKLCRALRLTWRGVPNTDSGYGGSPSFDASAIIQWRDDGGAWENPRQIDLTPNSETILRSLGVYRRRQWRVTFSGRNELVLARAEEEYELLAV